ncbi:LysR substrate-binding domain-containing protein [Streptomyces spirodelae]|uniref:LysR family transcriptional regulator n=1 Tax=Streptomyces spirodelae TaxID=2812904 RepID=A0ABS3WRY7_9ACTN|nr:LysR substrate-binding domain-containing protein [Streptomyces spirodelae]MBO8185867.1 LysR family transcriptional regulator [Streptomyces spirodelae]
MIDPRLQTLRVLHAEGTVTATAAVLHLTPSTVSQQLRQLAADLGVQLLQPTGRRVTLTPAAHTLVRHADMLHEQCERAAAALQAHSTGSAGHLRITGVATAMAAVMAPAVRRLHTRYPQMTFHLSEDPGEDRFRLLLADQADIAVVIPAAGTPPPDDRRYTQRPLLQEPQDLLVAEDHPLARRTTVELSDAAQETWVQAGEPHDQHQLLLSAAAAAGFTPRIEHAAVDWFAVASLVAYGHGICLMPRLAPLPSDLPVRRVPLSGPGAPTRRLVACVRRGSTAQATIARGLSALKEAADAWQSAHG